MNTTIIDDGYGLRVTSDDSVLEAVLASLARNNSFAPGIKRTIYNLSKKRNEKSHRSDYVLATTVFFTDGTKTTVKNSMNDRVSVVTEKIKLSDGTTRDVETASAESREIGLLYAILKRLICVPEANGTVEGKGFANFLRTKVREAWNQNVEEERTKAENEIRKTRLRAKKPAQKKEEKPSLRKCVQDLTDAINAFKKGK
jgi:hypothetical protein